VFSWLEGILFRPYPAVAHQERLFAIAGMAQGKRIDGLPGRTSSTCCTLCEDAFVASISGSTLNIGDHAQVATGSIVSANYFEALGVHPILGRGFEPGEGVGNGSQIFAIREDAAGDLRIAAFPRGTNSWVVGKGRLTV